MSRQQWAATMGEVDAPETDWRELVKHKPLKDQTTDPGAAAFDEAVTLFRSGLKRARQGKIELAVPLIACAYLLDARAVQFVSLLPDRDRENASYYFMDMNLLQDLIDHEGGNNFASQVLMIYAAVRFGHISNRAGQTRIAQALTVSDRLIKTIHADPSIENQVRGVLGGCLKRTTLHRMRCSLYVSLGNRKKAIQELAAALNIDPSLASVRCARACLYSSLEEKDTEVAAQEFRQTVTDAHPDSSELPIAYAWMAKLLLENNKLGNYDQAETYWKKSRQAAVRYKELYGETSKSVIEDEMQDFFATVDPPAQSFESREEELLGSFEDDRACFACGCTTNRVGGNLFQCSQCKQAYYCSTECQQHDWPNHNRSCQDACVHAEEDTLYDEPYFPFDRFCYAPACSSIPTIPQMKSTNGSRSQSQSRMHSNNRISSQIRSSMSSNSATRSQSRSSFGGNQTRKSDSRPMPSTGRQRGRPPSRSRQCRQDPAEPDYEEHAYADERDLGRGVSYESARGGPSHTGNRGRPPSRSRQNRQDPAEPDYEEHAYADERSLRRDISYESARDGPSHTGNRGRPPSRSRQCRQDPAEPYYEEQAYTDESTGHVQGAVSYEHSFGRDRNGSFLDERSLGQDIGYESFLDGRSLERDGSYASVHDEPIHTGKRTDDNRAIPPDRRTQAPHREPDIENGMHTMKPRQPLKDHEGQELANQRIRDYLVSRCEKIGPQFSRWWYHLPTKQRTDLLNQITQNTIPVTAASLSQVSTMLDSGGPRYGARVLTDFSLKTILAPCNCEEEGCLMHDYRDQLLHDLYYYVMCWEVAEDADYKFCVGMVDEGLFPDRTTDGNLKFMELPLDDDRPKVHRLLVMPDPAPPEAIESVLAMVDAGYIKEQLPFSYFLLRDSYRLAVYALLMELFDELELGKTPEIPLARLQGCEYCRQTCQETTAVMCQGCTSKWWCCVGCRKASSHGRQCPIGKPTKIRVQFS